MDAKEAKEEEGESAGVGSKPQVQLRLDLQRARGQCESPRSSISDGNSISSRELQPEHSISAVTELQLGVVGKTTRSQDTALPPGVPQAQLKVFVTPKPCAAKQQLDLSAVGGNSHEENVFGLTAAPNLENAQSIPRFLADYSADLPGAILSSGQASVDPCEGAYQEHSSQGEPEKAGTIEAIKRSLIFNLDWSQAYSVAAQADEETSAEHDANRVVRELLLREQRDLMQMESVLQREDLRRELAVLNQVLRGWDKVEALDKQLEAAERRLEEVEAAVLAVRTQLRYNHIQLAAAKTEVAQITAARGAGTLSRYNRGHRENGCVASRADLFLGRDNSWVDFMILDVFAAAETAVQKHRLHASCSLPIGRAPISSSVPHESSLPSQGCIVGSVSPDLSSPYVDSGLETRVPRGGSPLQRLQPVRRLQRAAGTFRLSKAPRNLRRRLQQAATAASAASVGATQASDCCDQGHVVRERGTRLLRASVAGPVAPAAAVREGVPTSVVSTIRGQTASKTDAGTPASSQAATTPAEIGFWRVVTRRRKHRRDSGFKRYNCGRSALACNAPQPAYSSEGAITTAQEDTAALCSTTHAEDERVEAGPKQCYSNGCHSMEATAAPTLAGDPSTAFVWVEIPHSEEALEELLAIDKRLEELASQMAAQQVVWNVQLASSTFQELPESTPKPVGEQPAALLDIPIKNGPVVSRASEGHFESEWTMQHEVNYPAQTNASAKGGETSFSSSCHLLQSIDAADVPRAARKA
ncbi:uncharacterized protein LOC34620740 [Cyclospora cayetanensis]|uniref:Uncharacterized protein LOC34620740 n=1 Tax=Cyclospora cayetanensis TaxID=88456 RepID=A0A6P6RSA4_9EIME|nr:uncharacterized protein LOC34620740 [Cyclospora cayetanensis]